MSEKLCNLIGGGMKETIDLIYPVGRTIICDHNPQDDYTWQKWEQDFKDVFPFGAGDTYAAGSTGGEATHVLTVSELPKNIGQLNALSWANKAYDTKGAFSIKQNHTDKAASDGSYFGDATYSLSGGGASHNNMPPYKAVKFWTRTA